MQILEAFHHPYYATGRSAIQHRMYEELTKWFGGLGEDEGRETIEALTKVGPSLVSHSVLGGWIPDFSSSFVIQESVRNGKNKRLGSEGQDLSEAGYGGCGHTSSRPQQQTSGARYNAQQSQNQYGTRD